MAAALAGRALEARLARISSERTACCEGKMAAMEKINGTFCASSRRRRKGNAAEVRSRRQGGRVAEFSSQAQQ